MSIPLLQIQNLSIGFKADKAVLPVVKGISFSINQGEIVAIVGESGSGKSVTALSLLQLLPKQAVVNGSLLFTPAKNSIELSTLPAKEITKIRGKEIAMIFQEPMTSLNPVFTCGYQVMEAIMLHQQVSASVAKQKTIKLFQSVQLPEPEKLLNRYPHELSGGQKQRVMIAIAMSCNPSLLIADEPTTALDVTVQKNILQLIKGLQQQTGMSVLLITHDLGLVADTADKIVVMYKGEIAEQGNVKDILLNPQHPYTKALLACRPALHSKGERLPVMSDFIIDDHRPRTTNDPQSAVENKEYNEQSSVVSGQSSLPVLTVENLHVQYPLKKNFFGKSSGVFKAVQDVSFSVNKGETIGLVGESGCGKTTLGRAILQLVKATSGKILLEGTDLTQLKEKEIKSYRREMQVVFQDPYGSLNPRITIGDAILEPMQVHDLLDSEKQRKEKVIDLLEKVNLIPEHFNRYPHQFSGGQRQRICIARALALNPSFLIFDESVSALDVSVQAQVLNLLNDLKATFGFTSIFISHDLSVVHYISDRILVMNKGKIVEEGKADDIYYSPKNEYTRKLIDSIPGKTFFTK